MREWLSPQVPAAVEAARSGTSEATAPLLGTSDFPPPFLAFSTLFSTSWFARKFLNFSTLLNFAIQSSPPTPVGC
jgi:hypothetical protein